MPRIERPSRRTLLVGLGRTVLALLATVITWRYVTFAGKRPRGGALSLGPISLYPVSTIRYVPTHELFVLHDAQGVSAISARCTHLGCRVQLVADGFRCPCHGARFDRQGAARMGPARRPLRRVPLEVSDDGQVWFAASAFEEER